MTPVSTRHSGLLIGILLVGVAVSVSHLRFGSQIDDCANPQQLYALDRIEGSLPRLEHWNLHDEQRIQVSEGMVPVPVEGADALTFRVRRNRDPKRLYRAPLRATPEIGYVTDFGVDWLPSESGPVPIHTAYGHTDKAVQLSLYLFIYDGRPVENMFREQMLSAPRHVLTGGPPLTLVTISGSSLLNDFEQVDAFAKQWLVSAWEFYEEVCTL